MRFNQWLYCSMSPCSGWVDWFTLLVVGITNPRNKGWSLLIAGRWDATCQPSPASHKPGAQFPLPISSTEHARKGNTLTSLLLLTWLKRAQPITETALLQQFKAKQNTHKNQNSSKQNAHKNQNSSKWMSKHIFHSVVWDKFPM